MHSYEQLTGARGRRIFYRAERFDVKSLFQSLTPATEIGEVPHRLANVSMSGLAAIDHTEGNALSVGEEVPIALRINNTPLHSAVGRIVRTEPTFAGTKVAVNFVDGYLDIPALLAKHREQILRRRLNGQFRPGDDLVDPGYRLMCADFLNALRRYKTILSQWKADNPSAEAGSQQERDMVALCEEHFKARWRETQREANGFIEAALDRPEALSAMKQFSEAVITPDLCDGPIWKRAYEKPLGYPGDHLVMNYVYSWKDQGDDIVGKFSHRLGLDALECVATRMAMVQSLISKEIAAKDDNDELLVTNLACGTAQEVINSLSPRQLDKRVVFSLIDQDEQALSYAYSNAYPHTIRHGDKAHVNCYHSSFTNLMKGGALTECLPPQDVVYSVGLFDYLRDRRAKALLRNLYQHVKPGGLLVIGNLKRSIHSGIWSAEMICDWTMYYRAEREMREMTEGLDCQDIEIRTDITDRIYLMCLRKPG